MLDHFFLTPSLITRSQSLGLSVIPISTRLRGRVPELVRIPYPGSRGDFHS
jgi:hypothetical protein